MMNDSIRKYPLSSLMLIAVLIAYSIITVSFYHYERLTGDATLYLSIAEKYIRGDFINAVNGYWGPLLSWLLIPFLLMGATHVFAINALNLIFGILTIVGVWRLSCRFEISENIRIAVLLPMVPIFVFISLIEPMDFLLLCVLVFYLDIVFRKDYPDRMFNGALSGVLGALAYFSKPYGFPFFISHFLLINACYYFVNPTHERGKKILQNVMVGFVLFSFLSGIWIALISNKYDRLTFSNMGRGVFASLGPESEHGTLEKGDPIFIEGFFEPPNETAFVIYEDPSYARKKTWNPLESRSSLQHYLGNLTENFFEGLRIYESYSRLSIAIVIVYILIIFYQTAHKLISRGDLLYPLITIILYTGGYFPFHFETRYLWIVNILLLLMGGKVLNELFQHEFFKKNILRIILTGFFILSFIVTPVKSSSDIGKNNLNCDMHDLGAELDRRYHIRGNIASNRQKVHTSIHDSWHQTFRLSYWLKSRYYGQARENIRDGDLEKELKGYNIDYYFLWGESNTLPIFLSQYKELTGGEMPGLKIYSLKERK